MEGQSDTGYRIAALSGPSRGMHVMTVHCVIPAGGISPDHRHWAKPRYAFFLPVKVLSRIFRGKFVDGLKRAYQHGELCLPGPLKLLTQEKTFHSFLRSLFRQDWVVYAKPPFGGPEYVLNYLARYTHRVGISNQRLVDIVDGKVTFRWKNYAHGNKRRLMTLSAEEFLRRSLLHVLPRGFVRIRFLGFLAHRRRATLLSLCRQLLETDSPRCAAVGASSTQNNSGGWTCPLCGGPMVVVERLTAEQIRREFVGQNVSLDTS